MELVTADRLAALRERLARGLREHVVPGVAVGIVAGAEEHTVCAGITNVEQPVPVDADTVFEIASVTKTMTATVAMRLVADGRLSLDAPVRHYLPDFGVADADVSATVTVADLFTHTAGWVGEYLDDTGPGDDALARGVAAMSVLRQLVPAGRHFSYNNVSLSVAGRIIEVITGRGYEAAMADLLFVPLGMTRSSFFADDVLTYRLAAGHTVRDGAAAVLRGALESRRVGHPVGGVRSTARDLIRYARFHLGDGSAPDGTPLLPASALAQMQEPRFPMGPGAGRIGLSWMLAERGGTTIAWHGGASVAQMTTFLLVPARAFGLVVLTNGANGTRLGDDLARWATAEWLGLPREPDPVAGPQPQDRAPYIGAYWSPLSDIDIADLDGGLVLRMRWKGSVAGRPALPPMRLQFSAPDEVFCAAGPQRGQRGDFLRGDDGTVASLRWGLRVRPRVR